MFLKLLERLGRKRIILDRESNEPYLERYYVFLKDRNGFHSTCSCTSSLSQIQMTYMIILGPMQL